MHPRSSQHTLKQLLSRRDFLALAGVATGSVAAACGAGTIGLYWLLANDDETPLSDALHYTTSTPGPRLEQNKVLAAPRIISRAEWGAREVNFAAENETGLYSSDNPEGWREYNGDLRDDYQTLVIHHSATYEIDDVATMRVVQDLHMDDRGWADVAYHYCVGKTGSIFEGRVMNVRGTHTAGYNTGSLGVCLLGNFEEEVPTQAQLTATLALVNWLALRLDLTHLAGHRDFNAITVCPGANLYPYLVEFAASADLLIGTDGYRGPFPETNDETAALFGCCCCGAT